MRVGIFAGGRTAEAGTTHESAERLAVSASSLGHEAVTIEVPAGPAGPMPFVSMLADIDVAYPLVSGLEALFEANGVPYIGSEPTAAGVVADKGIFNDLVAAWGYPQARYVRLRSGDPFTVIDGAALAYPLFVKPARLGASIGVSRISHAGDLAAAVQLARAHDPEVVVEEAVEGIEITIAVIAGAEVIQSRPGVAIVPEHAEFLDLHTKADGVVLDTSGGLSEAVLETLRATTVALTRQLGVGGAITHEHFVTPFFTAWRAFGSARSCLARGPMILSPVELHYTHAIRWPNQEDQALDGRVGRRDRVRDHGRTAQRHGRGHWRRLGPRAEGARR